MTLASLSTTSMPVNALVIGYGSIGKRHADLLSGMGHCVAVVTHQSGLNSVRCFDDTSRALATWRPDYVVIASRTSEHWQMLKLLIDECFRGRVLVEKPLFDRPLSLPIHGFSLIAVAYNLRCHPLLRKLKNLVDASERVATATIYVGSYLPDWRPDGDYRLSYSAVKEQGGGVLRDLSHEIDYSSWIFGRWRRLTAAGGRLGDLEINSDDAYTLLMETERCQLVTIHMNYLDRRPRREISVNIDSRTVHVDLIRNVMMIDGISESVPVDRDDTYRTEHELMLSGCVEFLCTLEEATDTVQSIEAAEHAAASHSWVAR